MASKTISELTVTIRWWVQPYLLTLAFLSYVFNCEPDIDKIGNFICKYGMVIES